MINHSRMFPSFSLSLFLKPKDKNRALEAEHLSKMSDTQLSILLTKTVSYNVRTVHLLSISLKADLFYLKVF